jgi:drug/metabolite transporter (DMT)-like permease
MVALTALASAACYALALVLAQIGLRGQSVLAGATVSLPITAAFLCTLGASGIDRAGFDPRGAAIFAGTGVVFPVAVTLLSFQGNRLLGPNLAGALGNATPLFAVSFGVLILGDHLTFQGATGLASIIAGVALLSIPARQEVRCWSAAALAVPLGAAIIRGTVQPVMKLGLTFWPEPLAATALSYTASASVMLGLSLTLGRGRLLLPALRAVPVFACVGLLNGASVLLLYHALAAGRVSLVAPLVAVYPVFTLAFSAVLLRGEMLHTRLLAGIGASVLGVVLLLARA